MTERFMVDDCGTLIDMHTRNTYDYVSDVTPLLNELHEENMKLKWILQNYNPQDLNVPLDNEELKKFIEGLFLTKWWEND